MSCKFSLLQKFELPVLLSKYNTCKVEAIQMSTLNIVCFYKEVDNRPWAL